MAVAFGNSSGTDYNSANVSNINNADVTKPSASVDGTLNLYFQAINDQTAGNFTSSLGAVTVVTGPTNAPTLFQAGAQRRAGATADGTPIGCNNSNGANAQKTGMILVITGHNTSTPIRAVGTTATGTSTAPQCPAVATGAQIGDLVVRAIYWHDDGDNLTPTRPGGSHTAGPWHSPLGTNSKAIAVDFYVAGSAGDPGTATYGLPSSRAWVADTIIVQAAAGGGGGGFLPRGMLLGVG